MVDETEPMVQYRTMDIHFSADFRFIETHIRTTAIIVHGKHDELVCVRVERKKKCRKQCMISSTLITFNDDDIQ